MPLLRSSLAWIICLFACISASAQEWERTIQQYQHTAWGEKEGAPSPILALAQTPDGYLWLGTNNGLFRFDGVTFDLYEPQSGGPLARIAIRALLLDRDAGLWIGFSSGGISLLKDGNVTNYLPRDTSQDGVIFGFAEDPQGAIWVAGQSGLSRFEGTGWKKVGENWGLPTGSAQTVFVDRKGTLWVATENTLLRLPPGAKAFQPTGIHVGQVAQIGQAANGKLWMAETTRSVRPIPLGDSQLPPDATEIRVGSVGILFDREGGLWATTFGDGLRRAPHPEQLTGKPGRFSSLIESFTAKDGLTDDLARPPVLEDREGNIWVGTQKGLDRFRKSNFVPVALPVPLREPFLAAGDDGDLWVWGMNLWVRVHGGHTVINGTNTGAEQEGQIFSTYRDPSGKIWWVSGATLYAFRSGQFTWFALPEELAKPRDQVLTEDHAGVLWVTASHAGLFCLKNGIWKRFETPPAIARLYPFAEYTDWKGRLWFGYYGGTIVSIENGSLQTISSGKQSPVADVYAIGGRDQHLWVGGQSGLAFLDGSRFQKVVPVDASHFRAVWGIEETQDGSLWLGERRGVVHIAGDEVARFLSDPSFRVHYELFDALDGLPGNFREPESSKEAQGTDGHLWFTASNGLAWLDPTHISRNTLPPPVLIRSLTADGKTYPYWTGASLPPLTRSLQIQFTALSLSIPERVRFRYRLDGFDKEWQDGGTRREVFYTNLNPRKYRFHVIACNNDGVWNETGAALDFSVMPAWYQTIWFRSACVVAFALLLWAIYQLRLQQLHRQFNKMLEVKVNERTRIARELHDTLLQSFQALLLRFQSTINILPERPMEAKQQLESAVEQTARAIAEGRDAVQGLRASVTVTNDLANSIDALGKELASHHGSSDSPVFRVEVEGAPRDLHPIIRDEIYRITGEAMRNAFKHAEAQQIEVGIRYDEGRLQVRVRDDGKGVNAKLLDGGERDGHFGLRGMRERAKMIGGRLEVWSGPESGTEIELSVPASNAYEKVAEGRRS